ncbi:pyridoxal phosphate-dependent transferase [Mycotypha africana]|uniref:pyridoxal phosphate-dependent transferase n=1 Tax=Mycotypha africana TaxID=64632 RepID=UPI002301CA9A|nr:pyridoxal phosphate-dependent transferase [Mycotypha africana]KAI8975669.1 pyridoxal phosphate-dependent transferase [Mycotypha africana]
MDYSKFLSERSKLRQPSATRALAPFLHQKDLISLGVGQPNPDTFPYASMSVTLKTGETLNIDEQLFSRALSYDNTQGLPHLNEWLCQLQKIEHNPPVDFTLSIGTGSQDLLTKTFEMLLNEGDPILIESPSYTGCLSFLKTLNCNFVDVMTDAYGIIPEQLEKILEAWPESDPSGRQNQPKPRCLYTIPSGGNPTGATSTIERKRAIYDICHKHDIIIIEDDAYYYLQFTVERVPSYLSMDVDGRVVRCDSMSKILSSGLRLGWVTGPKPLIERINLHTMGTNLQPSGIPQVMAYQLLAHWGHEGFFHHVKNVAAFYRQKRDDFVECLDRHMKGRATWAVPSAGMFFWVRLLGGINDSEDLIMNKALKQKVLGLPGVKFMPHESKTEYIRLSYSNVSKENMDEALRRLALVIDQEAEVNGLKIEDLGRSDQ